MPARAVRFARAHLVSDVNQERREAGVAREGGHRRCEATLLLWVRHSVDKADDRQGIQAAQPSLGQGAVRRHTRPEGCVLEAGLHEQGSAVDRQRQLPAPPPPRGNTLQRSHARVATVAEQAVGDGTPLRPAGKWYEAARAGHPRRCRVAQLTRCCADQLPHLARWGDPNAATSGDEGRTSASVARAGVFASPAEARSHMP